MSRAAKGALAFGAAVVLWRTADLFLFTDVPTGFCCLLYTSDAADE